jgi:putative membrane protein
MQDMMNNMMGSGASGFAWLWMLIPLLFWGGLLAVVVWVVVRIFPNRQPDTGTEGTRDATGNAEAILHERFARGEIDETEYKRTLETVRAQSAEKQRI